jgi:hypothetical protein
MQTKVSVGKEDYGKSIRLGVGDILEVSLPETDARAAWRVEVDTDVLVPISSPTNTQTVWVLDEADQMHLRSFRGARQGRATLSMTYSQVEGGASLNEFKLEVTIGNPPKPKPIRQAMPAPQLLIMMVELFIIAIGGALLSFRLTTVAANALQEKSQLAQIAERGQMQLQLNVGQADLLLGILGTVALGAVAGYALLRIVTFFASRLR